jgi:hypothetical protein
MIKTGQPNDLKLPDKTFESSTGMTDGDELRRPCQIAESNDAFSLIRSCPE